jgi:phenylpropionate dioxygenase-like ring-hydroxylating dioxygenase large terminal subunit
MAATRLTTLPASWYTDAEIAQLEHERIFRGAWQYVARADQVAEPRSYVAARAGAVPVVIVRDDVGELRGFVNVCRHRGHEVVSGEGKRAALQCPYHAWTYGLDGRLRAAPRSDREPGFSVEEIALAPVAVDTWGPFVFANPDVDAAPLAEVLGDLPERFGVPFGGLRFHRRAEWTVAANWKVTAENFLECYHCSVAHPGFSAVVDVSPDAYTLASDGFVLSQHARLRDGEAEVEGEFHLIWPNTVINVMPGRANVSIGPLLPEGPAGTRRFLDYWLPADADDAWIAEYHAFDDQVGKEDEALVESVQRGLESGMLERGVVLPESEQLIVAFEALVEQALDGSAPS